MKWVTCQMSIDGRINIKSGLRPQSWLDILMNEHTLIYLEIEAHRSRVIELEKMSMVSSVVIPNQSLHNVFVYGSLLADDVVEVLLKRVPPAAPATLSNHHRFSIKGRVYPAILPVEDKKVTGRVLQGISDLELFILDEFEDVEYERRDVDVYLKDNSEKLKAHAYIWSNRSDPNLYGDWDFEEWKGTFMNEFIKMTEEFIKELEFPEPKRRIETYESVFKQDNDKPLEP